MKCLIDSNIWLDIALKREGFFEDSYGAVAICITEGHQMLTAATSLKDIFYIVAKLQSTAAAYEAVRLVLGLSSIAATDQTVCTDALDLEQPDYEDGIIAASALAEKADAIITRDTRGFAKLPLMRLTPADFRKAQGWDRLALDD